MGAMNCIAVQEQNPRGRSQTIRLKENVEARFEDAREITDSQICVISADLAIEVMRYYDTSGSGYLKKG